ncbi:hypothetical protein JYQ62_18430 [Nostoc sp. UHCC 0702]|nr:hypothetical protein JYQ62_18430 [Nostoc sp. UHCC 0702]
MVVGSDAQNEKLHEEETAIASLLDASPRRIESASEQEEDSPTATDCTSLTLVDAVPSQSASSSREKQDLGVEPGIFHEDIGSAAAVDQNENSSTQAQGQVEQNQPASLKTENSVSGEAVQVDHEGYCSAAPVPLPEKWSSEAIALRSKARPWRMEKIKTAEHRKCS